MEVRQELALLKESAMYQVQAAKVLADTGVLAILERNGQPKVVGSHAAHLMVSGDIDIQVVGDSFDLNRIFEIQKELFDLEYFDHLLVIDIRQVKNHWGNFPPGYYLGPRWKIAQEGWSIDIWFFSREAEAANRRRGKLLISEEHVDDDQRALILLAKKWAKEKGLKQTSQTIYRLVLREKITSLTEIQNNLTALA